MNKRLCNKLRGVTGILLIFIAIVLFPYGELAIFSWLRREVAYL